MTSPGLNFSILAPACWARPLALLFVFLSLAPVQSQAHVGNPNVIYDGNAGPYPVRVTVRPPGVVPGLAEVDVRALTNGARRVTVLPAHFKTGLKGAPPPDLAQPVRGDARLFHAELWLMAHGPYSVHVQIEGDAGEGTVIVPVNSLATAQRGLPAGLGVILAALGIFLFVAAVALVGAAVRESVLEPGALPSARRTRLARGVMTVTAGLLALALYGGRVWWNREDGAYRNHGLFQPPQIDATARGEGAHRVLRIDVVRLGPRSGWAALVPDHGKLMHAFLMREPELDAFAHLHPVRLAAAKPGRESKSFESVLPPLPAGNYRLYADVTHETGFAQTLVSTVTLPPAPAGDEAAYTLAASDPDDSWHTGARFDAAAPRRAHALADGWTMTWEEPATLVAGRETTLRFAVRDAAGRPAPLERHMGMLAHAALRRDDGTVFTHLHPAGSISMAAQQIFALRAQEKPPGRITAELLDQLCRQPRPEEFRQALAFPCEFPRPGAYRVWVQVKLAGRVMTGAFDTTVAAR